MSNTPVTKRSMKELTDQVIKILPPQLANQIAAGEVVERPASVVKELVENSMDAGATEIQIEIEQGGQKRILVRDNGKGISKDQLTLALSRHATSKISSIDDLDYITSMGFRGEALASISSVSRLTLTSKPATQSEAWQAQAEGKQMQVEIKPAAHPDGTSIEVVDLFFNTPARRKFLRTGKTEFQHIEQIIKRIALTRPDIQFVLSHNKKVNCRYLSVLDISKRIEQVCGKNMLPNCAPIKYAFEEISLTGWCSKLGEGSATRDMQYTFVNGRMMKDKLLSHALRQAYEDTLPPQTFASYVLYLQVPPHQIDVNVHPAKHEVRFHQARQIHDIVFKAITEGLSSANNGGLHQELVQNPQHNYRQALYPVDKPQYQSSQRGSGSGAYKHNTPQRSQINASNEFYTSVGASLVNKDLTVDENSSTAVTSKGVLTFTINNYLYNKPFLVFNNSDNLSVINIECLARKLVERRLARSSLPQPLLMPVSIENTAQLKQADLKVLTKIHLVVSANNRKLILKQVPSELRQLPWVSIFAGLNISEFTDEKTVSKIMISRIAFAWLNTIEVTESILAAWITEIGQDELLVLIEKSAKLLHLRTWMDNERHD